MTYSAATFAEQASIPEDVAQRILDTLYENDLDPCDLSSVIWRIKDFVQKQQMQEMLSSLTDEDISGIVDAFIAERQKWQNDVPASVACADTAKKLEAAFNDLSTPESAWFFSQIPGKEDGTKFAAGDVVKQQILRVGSWDHPEYGEVEITKKTIADVVKNFEDNVRGIKIAVDENHDPDHKALGWFTSVYSDDTGENGFADYKLTQKGADLLNDGAYIYFSPEISFRMKDPETGKTLRNLLLGGALTNRPFFKGMQPLMASESPLTGRLTGHTAGRKLQAYFFSDHATMHKFLLKCDELAQKDKVSAAEKVELEALFSELPESHRNNATIKGTFAELCAKCKDPIDKKDGEADDDDGDEHAEDKSDKKPDDKEEGEEDDSEAADDEDEDDDKAGDGDADEKEELKTKGMKMSEDGKHFLVPKKFMESVENLQKEANRLQSAQRFSETRKKVRNFKFSETNKKGILLPKHVKKFTEFAAKLKDPMQQEFFELLGSIAPFDGKLFSEKGHGSDVVIDFSDAKNIPATDDKVMFYKETMGQDLETAQKSAARFYEAKKKAGK